MIEHLIQLWLEWYNKYALGNGYTNLEMILLALGFLSWVVSYIYIIKDIIKFKFVEMPFLIGPGNLAWEALWSTVFQGDLGAPFQWGCRMWFLLDIYINYSILKYGRKLTTLPIVKKHFFAIWAFQLLAWMLIVYTLVRTGRDDSLGVNGALLINIEMSALYLYQLLCFPQFRGKGMSYKVAWLKMIGTGVISIACALHWPKDIFLMGIGFVSWVLDIVYIYLYRNYYPEKEL